MLIGDSVAMTDLKLLVDSVWEMFPDVELLPKRHSGWKEVYFEPSAEGPTQKAQYEAKVKGDGNIVWGVLVLVVSGEGEVQLEVRDA